MSKFTFFATILAAVIILAYVPSLSDSKEVQVISEKESAVLRHLEPANQDSLQKNFRRNSPVLRELKKSYKKAFIAFLVLFIIFFIVLIVLIVIFLRNGKASTGVDEIQAAGQYA